MSNWSRIFSLTILIASFSVGVVFAKGADKEAFKNGNKLLKGGQFTKAIEAYNKVIASDSRNAKAYNNRGLTYPRMGKFDQAIADYTQAIKLKPKDSFSYYNNRGSTYLQKGNLDKAVADFKKAIEINPKLSKACNNLGNVYKTQGKLTEAITQYNKAIELNPKYRAAYEGCADAQQSQGKLDLAIVDYTKAIEIDPQSSSAYNGRAVMCFLNKQFDKSWNAVMISHLLKAYHKAVPVFL